VTTTTTPVQTLTSSALPTVEPTKKRFPRVEEIEVIGGYQSLERSCLVKNKVSGTTVSGSSLNHINVLTIVCILAAVTLFSLC